MGPPNAPFKTPSVHWMSLKFMDIPSHPQPRSWLPRRAAKGFQDRVPHHGPMAGVIAKASCLIHQQIGEIWNKIRI